MKNLLLALLCMSSFALEASYYQTSISTYPLNEQKTEYMTEFKIERKADLTSVPEVISQPKIISLVGQESLLEIGSEETGDLISVGILITDISSAKNVKASVYMKESNQVVLSFEHNFRLADTEISVQ